MLEAKAKADRDSYHKKFVHWTAVERTAVALDAAVGRPADGRTIAIS